jgi:hypothetical protein
MVLARLKRLEACRFQYRTRFRAGFSAISFSCRVLRNMILRNTQMIFWQDFCGECPSPFTKFPLGFIHQRLALYFRNQMDRFCEHVVPGLPEHALSERCNLEDFAAYQLYEKPWYEIHAVRFLDWIRLAQCDAVNGKNPNLAALMISSCSGKLGRLVEQYYWRFRFEKAAITGVGARNGASAGGKAKARRHKAEHVVRQSAASEIWKRRPGLSKIAVADAVKKRMQSGRTAKHIARFIGRQ